MSVTRPTVTVAAIVPAAGTSGRMGELKQLLSVDGRPMLLSVVNVLKAGGANAITVVVNAELRSRLLATLPPGVNLALNADPGSQMIDSVRIGLDTTSSPAGYLVCPCDAAGITAADVRRCIDAFAQSPARIIIATHAGRRGHPMIFPASLAEVVRSEECDGGLNRLARNRPQLVLEVECDAPGTVANINTRADYDRLR
jgi:molybdenum cofactor cytidylyltransferase